jgi:hypothetical protein
MVGVATWGSRIRDNPRLREVSPAGKLCVSEVGDGAICVSEPPDRRERLNPVQKNTVPTCLWIDRPAHAALGLSPREPCPVDVWRGRC